MGFEKDPESRIEAQIVASRVFIKKFLDAGQVLPGFWAGLILTRDNPLPHIETRRDRYGSCVKGRPSCEARVRLKSAEERPHSMFLKCRAGDGESNVVRVSG